MIKLVLICSVFFLGCSDVKAEVNLHLSNFLQRPGKSHIIALGKVLEVKDKYLSPKARKNEYVRLKIGKVVGATKPNNHDQIKCRLKMPLINTISKGSLHEPYSPDVGADVFFYITSSDEGCSVHHYSYLKGGKVQIPTQAVKKKYIKVSVLDLERSVVSEMMRLVVKTK